MNNINKNKIALVTGGTSGIGETIAEVLIKNGYFVIINYINDSQAKNFKNNFKNKEYKLVKADITNRKDVQIMKNEIISKYKKIYLLVNNAGIMIDKTLKNMSFEEFDKVINVNLTGTFNITKSMLDTIEDNGRIINITSISGIYGQIGQTNYASSKAGIIGFTKSLALETAKRGITVNAIAPGIIDTQITQAIRKNILEKLKKQIPLGYFGLPDDIANAVVFLASQKARYITRCVLHVDGGLTF